MTWKTFLNFIKSREFFIHLAIGILVCVALLLIVLKSLDMITRHGEVLKVPAVIGMGYREGQRILESSHFRVRTDSIFVEGKPGGQIIDQSPAAGDLVKDHRTIYLTTVKFTAPTVKIPRFTDVPFKEYESNLLRLGLRVDSIQYQSDIAKDLVLGVSFQGIKLDESSLLPKGTKVNLILGDGAGGNTVILPTLIGLSLDEARFAIRGAQLVVGRITYGGTITDSSQVKIIRQMPAPRMDTVVKVNQGTLVDLQVEQAH